MRPSIASPRGFLLTAAAIAVLATGAFGAARAFADNAVGPAAANAASQPDPIMPRDKSELAGYDSLGFSDACGYANYWHHADGKWTSASVEGDIIYDVDGVNDMFFTNPEAYYDGHESMFAKASAPLTHQAARRVKLGKRVAAAIEPLSIETINLQYPFYYAFESVSGAGGEASSDAVSVVVYGRPLFPVQENPTFGDFVTDLDDWIPIPSHDLTQKTGNLIGWNTFALFKGDISVGAISSTIERAADRLAIKDILNKHGQLRPGQTINTKKISTEPPYECTYHTNDSGDLTIGGPKSFNAAAAVGVWYNYSYRVTFFAPPPGDFSVSWLSEATEHAGAEAISELTVRNDSDEDFSHEPVDVQVEITEAGVSESYSVNLGPRSEEKISIKWTVPEDAATASLSAEVNSSQELDETDYGNNAAILDVSIIPKQMIIQSPTPTPEPTPSSEPAPGASPAQMISPPEPTPTPTPRPPMADATVEVIEPLRYINGISVITDVVIKNIGDKDIGAYGQLPVEFSIPSLGISMTRHVTVSAGGSAKAPFQWTAPWGPRNLQIIATVNRSGAVEESNYANNMAAVDAMTYVPDSSPRIDRDGDGINDAPIETLAWYEERPETRLPGSPLVKKRFYVTASTSVTFDTSEIKSGYGFPLSVTTTVSTNYEDLSVATPIQFAYAYLPTASRYDPIALEMVEAPQETATGWVTKWQFPVNPNSATGARYQYVPVDWPDGVPFYIDVFADGAYTPEGMLSTIGRKGVTVRGSMYDDYYIAER